MTTSHMCGTTVVPQASPTDDSPESSGIAYHRLMSRGNEPTQASVAHTEQTDLAGFSVTVKVVGPDRGQRRVFAVCGVAMLAAFVGLGSGQALIASPAMLGVCGGLFLALITVMVASSSSWQPVQVSVGRFAIVVDGRLKFARQAYVAATCEPRGSRFGVVLRHNDGSETVVVDQVRQSQDARWLASRLQQWLDAKGDLGTAEDVPEGLRDLTRKQEAQRER